LELPELWTPDDIYETASQSVIRLFHEDNRVERKSARIEAKDLATYLSVFANTQPIGGVIFAGVEKDGAISGCKRIGHDQLQKLHRIGEHCSAARMIQNIS
jgi:ATP-dependent DNA helicase RecG